MKDSITKRVGFSALTVLVLFLIWTIISLTKNNEMIYPSLGKIFQAFPKIMNTTNLKAFFFTILRVFLNIGICLLVSIFLAIATIKIPLIYQIIAPIMRLMRTIPFICLSLMIVLFFSQYVAPFIVAIVVILPVMYEGILAGFRQIKPNLVDDLALLDLGFGTKLIKVYLPLCVPSILLTLLQTLGLSFKVMIMGEYFAQTKNSLGRVLFDAKSNLLIDELMAWTIIIVLLVALGELIINILNQKRMAYEY